MKSRKFFKSSMALLIIVLMLPNLVLAADNINYARDELTMTDVTPDDWFFPYVSFVRENNIMQGTSETIFSPYQGFTRAQVAATLFRIHFGRAADATDPRANEFTDVPENEWFAPYITWANANNIVSGIGNNLFAPADIITRQQFAAMLHRFAESLTSIDTVVRQSVEWSNFTDRNQIADWAWLGMEWANFYGFMGGITATTIEPTGVVTRADVAAMFTRFVRHMRIAEISADDFVLTISVEEKTWPRGENYRVYVELKNNSGRELEIARYFLFYPRIPGVNWVFTRVPPPYPSFQIFENGSTISRHFYLNWYYNLLSGFYELTVEAIFYLGWEQPADPENEPWPWTIPNNARGFRIVSNTIVITVQ